MKPKQTYVAFLRGINIGRHHKVPMADLRKEMGNLGFEKVVTLLNSGNIVFDAIGGNLAQLEKQISTHLEKTFGFPVPTILRKAATIQALLDRNPFEGISLTKDIRLYISFLQEDKAYDLQLPWVSEDNSYKILEVKDKTILSVLDLSISKTPKAMKMLEQYFGKGITTRNWNTLQRIGKKIA